MASTSDKSRRRTTRANGRATRERCVEVATTQFAAAGYEATSLRQIAGEAGIDVATLKYHFADKPTLFAEVYRRGHAQFLEAIEPVLAGMRQVETAEQVRQVIGVLAGAMHAFVEEHLPFVRLLLFRTLEESADIIMEEDELQTVAISRIEATLQQLIDRGVIRPVDARALVVMLIAAFCSWHVIGRVKPGWLAEPRLTTDAGRRRAEAFFADLIEQYLLGS